MKPYELTPEDKISYILKLPVWCEAQKKLLEYLFNDALFDDSGWIKLKEGFDLKSLLKDFGLEEQDGHF